MDELVKRNDVIGQLRVLQDECPGFGFFGHIAIERIKAIQCVKENIDKEGMSNAD